jgi:Flp pilus assembly protein TadG
MDRRAASRSGQSLIESCIAIAVISLVFFGLFQVSQLYAAKSILTYSAMAGTRARTVGFNDFMVHKVVRAAAIPNAGRMVTPTLVRAADPTWQPHQPRRPIWRLWTRASRAGTPSAPQYQVEQSRIPLYLGTTQWNEMDAVLNYTNWNTIGFVETASGDILRMRVNQSYPLIYPFARSFYDADRAPLKSGAPEAGHFVSRESHYPLYLE